jgi:kynurenine formamidase
MSSCRILLGLSLALASSLTPLDAQTNVQSRFLDLSLLVAPEYPCTWPTFPAFQINHYQRIGPLSPYNSDVLIMDGNTGTQLDVPPHSVTLPASGLPNAGRFGGAFTDKIAAWQFCGEACCETAPRLPDPAVDVFAPTPGSGPG